MHVLNWPAVISILFVCAVFILPTQTQAAVLKRGSTGDKVSQMQQKLKNWGYYTGEVDGIFGSKTESAVRYFQRKNGLVEDGIVGPATAKKLGMSLSEGTSSGNSSSSNDVYLLARAVYGGARGEPYEGQVAGSAVILNRVEHPSFPNTIAGVIYQSGAFDVVSDGPDKSFADSNALRAARDAMAGWDPTNGCIYYYNPQTATNQWIKSRPIMRVIGNHVFCT